MADPGLTLVAYEEAKQLPLEFLRELGVSEISVNGLPALRMPYVDASGAEVAVRLRTALTGDRFRWRKGSKPLPYGLSRLAAAREDGEVVICEGESDAQTLWHHKFHALGIPGAATWKAEWNSALHGIEKVYVLIEPDAGGDAMLRWLASVPWRDRARLVYLAGAKDVNALHVADPLGFEIKFLKALDEAEPFDALEEAQRADAAADAWLACEPLATTGGILPHVVATVRALGVVRERRAVQLLYLALVSRLLDKPVSVAVKGPSSAGKSFLVEQVLRLFPTAAAYPLSSMSERALAYSSEPVAHRFLVLYEAAGLNSDFASYLLRSLLSEGRVRYETVEKTSEGLQARLIEREGPTGLIVTTTKVRLHPENETRVLSLPVTDTPEQTRAVLDGLAADGGGAVDLAPWHALQEWLAGGETRVVIPYASQLLAAVPPVAVRLRRDVPQVLALIRAHALLHRATRSRDAQGRIVATLVDYAVVRWLVEPLISAGVGRTVPADVRKTVDAVHACGGADVKVRAVATHLNLDMNTAWRRVQKAQDGGYLTNAETRHRQPAKLWLGDPLPSGQWVLPPARTLRGGEGRSIPPRKDAIAQSSTGTGLLDCTLNGGDKPPSPPCSDCGGGADGTLCGTNGESWCRLCWLQRLA